MSLPGWEQDPKKEKIASIESGNGARCDYYRIPDSPGKIFADHRVSAREQRFYLFELDWDKNVFSFNFIYCNNLRDFGGVELGYAGVRKEDAIRRVVERIVQKTAPEEAGEGNGNLKKNLENFFSSLE